MKNLTLLCIVLGIMIGCKTNAEQNHSSHDRSLTERPNRGERPSATQFIAEMDDNNDKKLSKTEVRGPLVNDFSILDKDDDGFISEQELNNAPRPQRRARESSNVTQDDVDLSVKTVSVNTNYFIKENIIGEITQEMVNLSGIETLCYIFKTHSQATEHTMGPWCPRHIDDDMENAGIWFQDGKVYDVSGHFIASLNEFYNDDRWELYREDGTINVTNTKEGCLAAAKPNVEEAYHNHCVECLPEYFKNQITTYTIPVTPQYLISSRSFGRGAIGVAFNGVNYDPPAPTDAILAAHTIAPLDDNGGHVNPHGGYHYHAVTGSTKEVKQTDVHSPIIGYAIDGFGIFSLLDANGDEPKDLDECGGHSDEIRGYHYHAGKPGENQIIKCLHGLSGQIEVEE